MSSLLIFQRIETDYLNISAIEENNSRCQRSLTLDWIFIRSFRRSALESVTFAFIGPCTISSPVGAREAIAPPDFGRQVNTSYFTDSYISFTLKLEPWQILCYNRSIRSSTYDGKKIEIPSCRSHFLVIHFTDQF